MYRNILVPIDLDTPASWKDAFSTASAIADCFSAKVTICSVVSDAKAISHGEWLPISIEQELFDTRARLEGLLASGSAPREWGVEVASGSISGGVLDIAGRIGVDLIVLASHEPAARDYLLAAHAIRIARRASCSVLIARRGKA